MADAQLPMTIVGGFLGAGKTTLLNHILRTRHGLRVLVMVNDFGRINIDASLIESTDAAQGIIALSNGCVCCAMAGELMGALMKIEALAPDLDWMIIEGSGVSDPGKIAQIGRAGGKFQLRSIVVVVDASSIRETAADRYVGDMVLQQLASAHMILLNKIDLVDEPGRLALARWLAGKAPEAVMVEAIDAEIDWEILLDPSWSGKETGLPATKNPFDFLAPLKTGPAGSARFVALTIEQTATYDEDRLKQVLGALDASVLRIKGIVRIGSGEGPFLLQYSPNRQCELSAFRGAGSSAAGKLVVVGSAGLDKESVQRQFNSAQVH
jgi:G3E family GTPase